LLSAVTYSRTSGETSRGSGSESMNAPVRRLSLQACVPRRMVTCGGSRVSFSRIFTRQRARFRGGGSESSNGIRERPRNTFKNVWSTRASNGNYVLFIISVKTGHFWAS
jgi:hypothetical protein